MSAATESEYVIVHEIAPYATSRDYARLAELAKKASVVCIVNYPEREPFMGTTREVTSTHYSRAPDGFEVWQISARTRGFVWAKDVETFVAKCRTYDVEFFEPPLEI
jgi:hypothetical protein